MEPLQLVCYKHKLMSNMQKQNILGTTNFSMFVNDSILETPQLVTIHNEVRKNHTGARHCVIFFCDFLTRFNYCGKSG